MTNKFMNALKNESNYTLTENGAVTYKSTLDGLLDLFALGGAYRTRSEADVINLFQKAFQEDEVHALKCLFYLRDVRGGQGERRFFRVVTKWLAREHTGAMKRNLQYVPEFGRWDDLYEFIGTPLEKDAFKLMHDQLALDVTCKTPSLLAKWLKSENTSSLESKRLGNKTRMAFGMTHREYRKTLSILRDRINVLERLMSAGRWDEIEFDKIPSRAGMIYKNAFARHDIERMKSEKDVQSYEDFAKDKNTKVNAKALYPFDVTKKAMEFGNWGVYYGRGNKSQDLDNTERLIINKYWQNLENVFNGYSYNGICVCDTSGSMYGDPLAVAISIAMYCAEHNTGDFANHFFTFSNNPTFVEIEGVDFVDKVNRIAKANWGGSTNIEAVFDKMLAIAKRNHLSQNDIPQGVIIVSDMEFNSCVRGGPVSGNRWAGYGPLANETLFETIEKRWNAAGYRLPTLTFWNVNARNNRIAMRKEGHVNFVSGMSPTIFTQVMTGKDAISLMMDTLNAERYSVIK